MTNNNALTIFDNFSGILMYQKGIQGSRGQKLDKRAKCLKQTLVTTKISIRPYNFFLKKATKWPEVRGPSGQ